MNATTIKIGRRTYFVESTKSIVNRSGQPQQVTNLKGQRGADVILIETTCKYGTVAKLIHIGRFNPGETIDSNLIKRF